jgi:hypothetical protein
MMKIEKPYNDFLISAKRYLDKIFTKYTNRLLELDKLNQVRKLSDNEIKEILFYNIWNGNLKLI